MNRHVPAWTFLLLSAAAPALMRDGTEIVASRTASQDLRRLVR